MSNRGEDGQLLLHRAYLGLLTKQANGAGINMRVRNIAPTAFGSVPAKSNRNHSTASRTLTAANRNESQCKGTARNGHSQ
eukprot:4254343-Pleurochrysis_carterae.AAC.1